MKITKNLSAIFGQLLSTLTKKRKKNVWTNENVGTKNKNDFFFQMSGLSSDHKGAESFT